MTTPLRTLLDRVEQGEGADRIAELEAALRIAREALASSYNVTTYPGDGAGRQAEAIRVIDRALLRAKIAQEERT